MYCSTKMEEPFERSDNLTQDSIDDSFYIQLNKATKNRLIKHLDDLNLLMFSENDTSVNKQKILKENAELIYLTTEMTPVIDAQEFDSDEQINVVSYKLKIAIIERLIKNRDLIQSMTDNVRLEIKMNLLELNDCLRETLQKLKIHCSTPVAQSNKKSTINQSNNQSRKDLNFFDSIASNEYLIHESKKRSYSNSFDDYDDNNSPSTSKKSISEHLSNLRMISKFESGYESSFSKDELNIQNSMRTNEEGLQVDTAIRDQTQKSLIQWKNPFSDANGIVNKTNETSRNQTTTCTSPSIEFEKHEKSSQSDSQNNVYRSSNPLVTPTRTRAVRMIGNHCVTGFDNNSHINETNNQYANIDQLTDQINDIAYETEIDHQFAFDFKSVRKQMGKRTKSVPDNEPIPSTSALQPWEILGYEEAIAYPSNPDHLKEKWSKDFSIKITKIDPIQMDIPLYEPKSDEEFSDDSEEYEDPVPRKVDNKTDQWCYCRKPHNNLFMVQCFRCREWFHGKCIAMTMKNYEEYYEKPKKVWRCHECKQAFKHMIFVENDQSNSSR